MKKKITVFLAVIMVLAVLMASVGTAYAANTSSAAGTVATASGNLNVRQSASTSSAVVASLPKGGYVTLLSKSGAWWYVEYADGRYGYCSASYIRQVSGSYARQVTTSSGNLNVRSGPSPSYGVIGSLPKGKHVVVLSQTGDWSKILYHGTKTGYVSSSYLSSRSTAYQTVSLQVPDFKQTDSRWANVVLGKSGQTIGKIGCTTTALSMMESYRRGRTIYPDAMSKELSYSSGGSLYWPSNYVITTDGSNYLSTLYHLLTQGKPVILGATNGAGKQHWVVVKGVTGGTALSAASFQVNDPGSNSRTTLQQFLSVYPNFYKIAYYK